jgi:hypothetical protein
LLILWMVCGLVCQARTLHRQTVRFKLGPRAVAEPVAPAPVHVFREIKDPQSGADWVILPNAANPGGPGRMVLERQVSPSNATAEAKKIAPIVAIHLGDRVVVEEHTRVAEAYLEAVALEPAVAGGSFRVRLKIGGKVVRVMAIAPGRAAFTLVPGVQP